MFDLKRELKWAQLKVGVILTAALMVLFLSVFFSGAFAKLLYPKIDIRAAIPNAKGLKKGAPVWVFGIEQGAVTGISLDPKFGTVATISLDKKVLGFLRKDSTATIMTMGLLGDKYIELTDGSQTAGMLQPGDMIRGAAQFDMKDAMETAGGSIQKMTEFIDKTGALIDRIRNSQGTFSKILDDPALYNNLAETSKNLAALTRELNSGRGSLGLFLKDPTLYDRLSSASQSFEKFSLKLAQGQGTMQKLMDDDQLYRRLTGAAASLEEFGGKLNTPNGTLGKLATDSELYDNLARSAKNLSEILERMERGEGSAGVLLKDQDMARDLKQTASELRALVEDIKKQPRRYFKFSIF